MNPTRQQLHISRPLTNISIAYMQSADNFVASRVFPVVPVDKQTDQYFTYNRGDFNRNQMRKRARGAEVDIAGYNLSTDNYRCDVWGLGVDISEQDRANTDSPLNLDADGAEYLAMQGMISQEVEWADTFFKTGIWGTERAGVASGPTGTQFLQWSDTASTPFKDIAAAKTNVVLTSGGFTPNTLVLGRAVYDTLQQHPEVIDRVRTVVINGGGDSNKMITVDASDMAAAFGVARVLIMSAVQNTAVEGAAETTAFIGGKHALLCYSAPRPALKQPSAGYTFAWRGLAGNNMGVRNKKYTIDSRSVDRIEIEHAYDMKATGTDLGQFFLNAAA